MGNVPARNIDRRRGRANRSDRSNNTSGGGTDPALVPAGNWIFYEYPIAPREPGESMDTGNDDSTPDEPAEVRARATPTEPKPEPAEPEPAEPKPEPAEPPQPAEPLKVTYVDLMRKQNEKVHHTSEYDPEDNRNNLIVRRGQAFDISLDTDRKFDEVHDEIRIVFEIDNYVGGIDPKPNNGTQKTLHMKHGLRRKRWGCEYVSSTDNKLVIRVKPAADASIGRWSIIAQTSFHKTDENEEKKFHRFKHFSKVFIIFNPFEKDDEVYIEDEIERDEYVMAESGHIFVGNYRQPWARPWNFGQFEENILDCALLLLDMSNISYKVRGNPVYIARALSATANQADENGVLVGNWSGDYEGGASPTSWAGSIKIIQQFYETRQPVMFGQCWVFSGVLTALCRALGLPTRSVTNFASAHDTDESVTIDTFWTEDGKKDEWRTSDSVWNFHVWNEAWMRRSDLPSGYDGWQAFDATPQETSDGIYQAGPAPCKAIKEGIVDLRYDTQFIFAEVNADRVNWKMIDGEFEVTTVEKNRIGLKISTNVPRKLNRPPNPWAPSSEKYRLDVTDHYKYNEGTQEERAAVRRAHSKAIAPREGIYDHNTKDVSFELNMKDGILLGSNFDVVVRLQNKSREKRTVKMTLTLSSVYYTGVVKDTIKSKKFQFDLEAIKADDAVMRIGFEEYMYKVTDSATFVIDIDAVVIETYQNHSTQEEFRLRRPDLQIEGPVTGKRGKEFEIVVKFASSMSIPLTACTWEVEGPGLTKAMQIKERDCEPYDRREITVQLKPKKVGDKMVVVTFNSKELQDVVGEHNIVIQE